LISDKRRAQALFKAFTFASEALERNTNAGYASHWKQYEAYCRGLGFETSDPMAITSFVEYRTAEGRAFSTIRGDLSAISNHFRHDSANPTHNSYVSLARIAAKKKAPAVKHRDPLTRNQLITLSKKVDRSNVASVRDFLMILIAYRAYLRAEEVSNIRSDEIWVDAFEGLDLPPELTPPVWSGKDLLWIAVSTSKMNPQKQKLSYDEREVESVIVGHDIVPDIDPIEWFQLFDRMRNPKAVAFFHRLDGQLNDGGFLSKNTFNHIVKDRLFAIGITDGAFGGHSCRAGGATEAARHRIETRLIMRHGRWKSNAVNIYIRDDRIGELELNAALGGFAYHSGEASHVAPIEGSRASAASSASSSSSSSSTMIMHEKNRQSHSSSAQSQKHSK